MSQLIRDLSSPNLLAALESNMTAYWMAYGRAPKVDAHDSEELRWVLMGIPEALFNAAFLARMTAERLVANLNELHAAQARRQVPMLWWLGPTAQPPRLEDTLAEHGWTLAGTTPGMAVELVNLAQDTHMPPDVTIERVQGEDDLRLWAQIAGEGTGFPAETAARFSGMEPYAAGYPSRSERRNYLAYLDGEPVATSAMVLNDGVAGIYAVATLPDARRRGIGAALSRLPLLEAQAEGYRVGTLQASDMGHPVYRNLGFQDVCMFKIYLRQPHAAQP